MKYHTLLPLNVFIMLGAVLLTAVALSILIGVGAYGGDPTNPLTVLGTMIAYGFPYLGMLGLGGLVYLAGLGLAPWRSRLAAFLFAPLAALPAVVAGLSGPQATAANIHTPVIFAIVLALAVRLPKPEHAASLPQGGGPLGRDD